MAEGFNLERNTTLPIQYCHGICGITAVAILCFVGRLEGAFPYRTLPSAALLVLACLAARRRKSPDLAWSLFAIGWLIAIVNVVHCLFECFNVLGGLPRAAELQRDFMVAYVSNLALPLFLSLPAVQLAATGSRVPFLWSQMDYPLSDCRLH